MKPMITKMKLPDVAVQASRTKPWVPPPARTTRESGDETKVNKLSVPTSPARRLYTRRFTVPLLDFSDHVAGESHVGYAEPVPISPGVVPSFYGESDNCDTSVLAEMHNCEAETQTEPRLPPLHYFEPDALKLPDKVELHKLAMVVQHLEEECSHFREALKEKNTLLTRSQEELGIFLGHMHALRTALLLAENCSDANAFLWPEEESIPSKIKDLKVNAWKVREVISTLLDKDDGNMPLSAELPRIWSHLTKVLARLENDLWESCKDHLTTCLRRDIESKEKEIAQLQKDLEYYMKREEDEKQRQDRCLDLIQELQRKCYEDNKTLRKGAETWEMRAAQYEDRVRDLADQLSEKDRKLQEVTSEAQRLRTSIEKMHLERIDVERALITMKSKVADLEPLILNPTGNIQTEHLMNELREHKDEIRFLKRRLQEVSQQRGVINADGKAVSRDLHMLKEALLNSRDPKTKHLVALVKKIKQQILQLTGDHWDPRTTSLKGQTSEPTFGYDREKERLTTKVEELQEKLDQVTASNQQLMSYIATLRRSYTAVFCDSPELQGRASRPDEEDRASY